MNKKRKLSRTGALIIIAAMLLQLLQITAYADTSGTYEDESGNTYTYTENEDGTVTITDFTSGGSTTTVIPSEIDGRAVSKIGNSAFLYTSLTEVSIPGSVKEIGNNAFSSSQLTSVTIADGVISIGDYAFSDCYLQNLTIPSSVISIGKWCFLSNDLTSVTIQNSAVAIGTDAFVANQDSPADLTIYGYANSTAQAYATDNGHTFALLAPSGQGTEEDPYQIQSANDLLWISSANSLHTGFNGKHFEQTKDIDMSSITNFTPIGDEYILFNGTYDGNNYKISDLTVKGTGYVGLFGFLDVSGVLRNLILEDVSIKAIGCRAAGEAVAVNLGTIQGVHITVSSTGNSLISVSGKKRIAFGFVAGTNEGTVLQSSNETDLIIDDFQGDSYALGGIAGENSGSIKNCFNTGNISVEESDVPSVVLGGITGISENGGIQYCYNTGVLTINNEAKGTYKGGIAGAAYNNPFMDNFYLQEAADYGYWYVDDVTGELEHSDAGTEPKPMEQLKNTSTFVGWDTGIWTITMGRLPQLSYFPAHYAVTYNGNGSTGGTAPEYANRYIKGETITILGNTGNLTKTGYTFDGWNAKSDGSGTSYTEGDNFTVGTADVLLYAKWKFDHYILTYTAGTNGEITGTPTQTINHGEDGSEVEAVADIGYHFVEWSDGIKSAKRTDTNVTDNVSVTAIFALNQYVLSFNSNGGSEVVSQNIEYNKNGVKPEDPVKSGYIFAGWYEDTSFVTIFDFDTAIISNRTLYAKWTAVSSGHDSSGGSYQAPSSNNVPVTVGGQTQQQAATGTTQTRDGKTVTTVTLDVQRMMETINSSETGSSVTIPVTGKPDIAVGELNGQLVKAMENKQAILEIKTDDATYTLPAQQINIDAVSSQLGQTVNLSDIKVSIEIAKSSDEAVKVIEDNASKGNFSIVVPPIDFTVKCTYGDQTINVSQFSSYVERTVAIPEGVDPQKITTAVVVEPDGTLRHVPTKIIMIDGKYYARINSLTNSAYSVIWNPIDFKDAAAHWAKEAINDMGSRMIISGTGNDMFEPDRDITRAEFAAVIVRALGLKPDLGQNMFSDVPANAWYGSYVMTAYEYRIISGYGDGEFGPNNKITREQAMAMVVRAMNITELKVGFASGEVEKLFEDYKDADKIADYARNSTAVCIKVGVATGKNDKQIAPKDNITRAEAAVIIQRLLQKSNLI